MRKFYTTLVLGFSALQAMACDVLPGQLEIKSYPNNIVKIWLSEQPVNECFPTDSASLRVKFVCRNGQYTKEEIALTDTLIYEISGETSVGFSVIWWHRGKQVGRTDAEPQTLGTGNGLCFKRIGLVESAGEPDISTENPPPTPYEISFGSDFLVVTSPWPGQIRIFDQTGMLVKFQEFGEGFLNFDLNEVASPGHFYYVNVLLFRPTSEGGLISETFTIWH